MKAIVYVAEFHGKEYLHNDCSEHDTRVFSNMSIAMDAINKELAEQQGIERPKILVGHVGYGVARKNVDGKEVEQIAQYYVNGHWRTGGINIYPYGEIHEGQWERVELFPMEVE